MSARRHLAGALLVSAIALSLASSGCKGESGSYSAPSGSTTAGSATAPASPSAQPTGSAASSAQAGASTTVTGAYEAKAATVFTPDTAPPFQNDPAGALGPGTLTLVLPADGGEVTGEATGALGALKLHGLLEGTRLTAQATPDPNATPAMWGTLVADVKGSGDARALSGTLRASSADGHIVREAAFTLTKK